MYSDASFPVLGLLQSLRLRKARALVFYLAAEANTMHRTEKILDLFWQDSSLEKAQTSCRQVVRHIRVAWAGQTLITLDTRGGLLRLRMPDAAPFEVALAEGLAGPGWSESAADDVRAVIGVAQTLQGISASFDSWLAIVTQRLMSVLRSTLDVILARGGQADEARTAAKFAVELEPANEVAVRFLMRQDWGQGRATRAIERYDALYAYLDAEFDQEPEPETIALLAAIKLNPTGGSTFRATGDLMPKVSLSVALQALPEMDRELASLAAVLFADLRMRLARFREWRVMDATTSPSAQMALQVKPVVLLGRLQLQVDVTRAEDGRLLWAEAIDAPDTGWEGKVRLLVTRVAAALSVVVAERSLTDAGSAVYDRWLRSQAMLDAWSPETEGQAVAMLRDITRDAPRFGPAHAELAGALNVRQVFLPGTRQTEDIRQLALHHAIEAVSIDPLDTRAHRVLAWCYCYMREFELAEFHFDQALALNRSNPLTLASCALGFAFTSALDRAAELVAETKQHAAVMEPFHLIYLAAADYLRGEYQATADQCARGTGLMTTVAGWHSAALWQLGQKDAATHCMADWFRDMQAQWRGDGPATPAAIIDWFTDIFPLRHEAVRNSLRATLGAVADHPLLASGRV